MTALISPWIPGVLLGAFIVVASAVLLVDWLCSRREPVSSGLRFESVCWRPARECVLYDWAKEQSSARPLAIATWGLSIRPGSSDLRSVPASGAERVAALRYIGVLDRGPLTADNCRDAALSWDALVRACGHSVERALAVELQVREISRRDRRFVGVPS